MARLWALLSHKFTYMSVMIIVLANLLLIPLIKRFFAAKLNFTSPIWLLDFAGMFVITFITFVICLEVFEL
jgi:hypothetical protein